MKFTPTERAAHWQQVDQTKSDQETSWFEPEPARSINLVREFAPAGARVVDIGGGASILAGRLVEAEYDVTVVDIAPAAIERAKLRIGATAARIRWMVADIVECDSLGEFDFWHDRAVFHFLTELHDRARYVSLASRSVVAGGHLAIGAFAVDGPEKCSGLPVERYDQAKLIGLFSPHFEVVRTFHETHTTPWGKPQAFFFAVMRRVR